MKAHTKKPIVQQNLPCPECGWELDSIDPPHDEMHEWIMYWNALTPDERAREHEAMMVYANECHDCMRQRSECVCRK